VFKEKNRIKNRMVKIFFENTFYSIWKKKNENRNFKFI
jgi:hypothetical protein